MGALWTFLNSPLFMYLVTTVGVAIVGKVVKDKTRREKILDYATTAFDVAEMMGRSQGLTGVEKYAKFLKTVTEKLKAAKEKPLTLDEEKLLHHIAAENSWVAKGAKLPKAVAMPLPPPPRG